jgi:hypothetical protein
MKNISTYTKSSTNLNLKTFIKPLCAAVPLKAVTTYFSVILPNFFELRDVTTFRKE